jgi:phage tail-like protein
MAGIEAVRGATGSAPAAEAAEAPFTAGRFVLDLDGEMAGHLVSAEGGHASAEVVEQAPGPSCLTQKNLGRTKYEDISLAVGTGMSESFYEWVQSFIQCQSDHRSGAILAADFDFKEVARREFSRALITEVGFPKLDGSSRDPATLIVSMTPEETRRLPGSGKVLKPCPTGRSGQKKLMASNFRLTIDGLDCTKVTGIDAFAVKQPVADRIPGRIEIPNLTVTLLESGAESFYDWHEDFVIDGNSGANNEKKGRLELLAPNLSQVLLAVEFQNLGIFSLKPAKAEAAADQIARVTAEMYCEAMALDFSAAATAC